MNVESLYSTKNMSKGINRNIQDMSNLKDILAYSCRKYSDMNAYFEKSKETGRYEPVTFKALYDYTTALGTALCGELGLKGKRIAIISENRYQWMISYLAIVCGTGVVVPIDRSLFPPEDVAQTLTKARCEAVIFSESKKQMVEDLASELPFIKCLICLDDVPDMNNSKSFWQLVEKGRDSIAKGDRSFLDAEINENELAILLFTSGTTAASKAVMLSHRNIASNVCSASSDIDLREGETAYSILPLHHTYECTVELMLLYNGMSLAVCEGLRFVPDNLQEAKPNLLVTVPAFLERIVKRITIMLQKDGKQAIADMIINEPGKLATLPPDVRDVLLKNIKNNFGGDLRLIFSGAAPLDDKLREFFQTIGISVLVGYGITETSPINTLLHNHEAVEASIGKAIPGVEVKIANPGGDGNGEICVKGPNVMLGYLDDEKATSEVLDDEGWFATGDMGYIDESGFLHISGRKKEMIVLPSGKKVFPHDIEPMFSAYPIVKEAIICDMSGQPGKERVGALVVIDEEYYEEISGKETRGMYNIVDDIVDEINEKLAGYKKIRGFKIRKEEFPKTTTSKIKRHLVKWEEQ